MIQPIAIPTFDVNNDFVYLVDWYVQEGEAVEKDAALCCVDTAKATYDIAAAGPGFVKGLRFSPGDEVPVGETVCFIVDSMDRDISGFRPQQKSEPNKTAPAKQKTDSFLATNKAVEMADQRGIDLGELGLSGLIRTKDIKSFLDKRDAKTPKAAPRVPVKSSGLTRVAVYGAGDHGILVKDWLDDSEDREFHGFLDTFKPAGELVAGGEVLGGRELISSLADQGVTEIFVTVFDRRMREELNREALDNGLKLFSIIHPSAMVDSKAVIGPGSYVKAGAVIDSYVEIGEGCIIDNGCIVAHHSKIGKYCHLTPGVVTGGAVEIGDYTLIAMNSCLMSRTSIGKDCWIDMGSIIKNSFPDEKSYIGGNPAKVRYKLK